MADRRIICKIVTGSRLYGTHRPDSDEDYTGVFLPSTQDLLGLQNCPSEWTENVKKSEGDRNEAGDVDCKFYSLQRFMNLAAQGQPGQLELLFAPEQCQIIVTPEWGTLLANRDLFLSQNGIAPFLGFAISQAHKATIKGNHLNQIKAVIEWGENLSLRDQNMPIANYVRSSDDGQTSVLAGKIGLTRMVNDRGYTVYEIAGRKYDVHLKTKTFIINMKELIGRYGSRSEAAAQKGFDYKSLMHAYRLLSQAKEFLSDGHITMPRPDAEFLKTIRAEQYDADYFNEITESIDEIRRVIEPASKLPKAPNKRKLEELCQKILYGHLFGKL